MIVKVKRLERHVSWGVKNKSGNGYKEKYDNCFDKLVPALDRVTGTLKTGLSKKQEAKFETELGLEKGALAKSGDFWKTYVIIIPEEGLTINTDDPSGELKYIVLQNDAEVANNLEEARIKAKARYVMTTDAAEAVVKNTKRDVIANAYAKFATMTAVETQEALFMFGKNPESTTPEVCRNILGEVLENNPTKFLSIVGDELFKEKVALIKIIKSGIVRKGLPSAGYQVPLYFGEIALGTGLDEALQFLNDTENNSIYVGLKKAYAEYIKK